MNPQLALNLAMLALVAVLLVGFPDRLNMIPLILSRVNPTIESNGKRSRSRRRSRAKPRRGEAAPRAKKPASKKPTAKKPASKKPAAKAKRKSRKPSGAKRR